MPILVYLNMSKHFTTMSVVILRMTIKNQTIMKINITTNEQKTRVYFSWVTSHKCSPLLIYYSRTIRLIKYSLQSLFQYYMFVILLDVSL